MRVLIAEDEQGLARGLQFLLEKNGFTADTVDNGLDALHYFHEAAYDAVILDIMMPGKNGLDVLREIRREGSAVPVMMLTAKSEIDDRVLGLESGADDYLPKPFATKEFLARVKALSRRGTGNPAFAGQLLTFGNVTLDCGSYELRCGEKSEKLSNKEFRILELLFRYPRRVFSSEHIMDAIWAMDSDAGIEVVWTYIGFLRRKLKAVDADLEIRTVRGAGYSLEESAC
jgi:DNA-binding response OmpR family regulator